MARRTATGQMIDRFRYGPGDGHLYVWPGGEATKISVYRIKAEGDASPVSMILADTGDRIDIGDTARTATAMVDLVQQWKASRP